MKKLNAFILVLLNFLFINQIMPQKLISYELKMTYNVSQIQTMFDQLGIPAGLMNMQVKYVVKAYKVTYQTVGVDSITPVIASGVFFVPEGYNCKIALVDYNHGTMFKKQMHHHI